MPKKKLPWYIIFRGLWKKSLSRLTIVNYAYITSAYIDRTADRGDVGAGGGTSALA